MNSESRSRNDRAASEEVRESSGSASLHRSWLLVALLALAALAIRLYGLGRESLWNDELFTATLAAYPTSDEFWERLGNDVHPPLYFLLVRLWAGVFGDSETALRMPSVLAGTALVPAMYFLGARVFAPREGLYAAAIAAFGFQAIFYSQEARMYSPLILCAALAGASFWSIWAPVAPPATKATRTEPSQPEPTPTLPKTSAWIAYALFSLCAAYLHYFGLLAVALADLALVGASIRRASLRWGAAAVVAAHTLAYLPWLPALKRSLGREGYHAGVPGLQELAQTFGTVYWSWAPAAAGVALVLVIAAARWLRPESRKSSEGASASAFLAVWAAAPVVIAFLKSRILTPTYIPRFFLVCAPAAWLLFVRAWLSLPLPRAALAWLFAGFLLFATGGQIAKTGYFLRETKEPYRRASQFVLSRLAQAGPIEPSRTLTSDPPSLRTTLAYACSWDADNFGYYFRRAGKSGLLQAFSLKTMDSGDLRAAFADPMSTTRDRRTPLRVWFLSGNVPVSEAFRNALFREATIVEQRRFDRLWVALVEIRR